MVKISVIIPVYNEIRFIQKTLESVVDDADEIILSDNASTDGTSDICQSFANKYPKIKYTRHKENIGSLKNFYFCANQPSGKYVRNIGAHDMISIGSNQSMALLLDKYADVVMVYPKYVIGLKEDYSFEYFRTYEEFGNDLLSDSAMTRTKSMIFNLREFSLFFGLWRAEVFKNRISPRIFTQFSTDRIILSTAAINGKMFPDDRSVFFRIRPRFPQSAEDRKKRYINMMSQSLNTNSAFWFFAMIAEQYDLALEMFNENPELCQEILNISLTRYSRFFSDSELTLENMPPIIPQKQELCQKVMNFIKEYIETKKVNERKKEKIQKTMLETDKKIYLFGAGKTSRDIMNALPNVCWAAFIENDASKIGMRYILPIISFNEFIKQSENTMVCITSPLYGDEMKRQLINNGFQEDSIIDYYKVL